LVERISPAFRIVVCTVRLTSTTRYIVAPSFIEVAERFCLELKNTIESVGVLLVLACAKVLNFGTQYSGCTFANEDVGEVDAGRRFGPCRQLKLRLVLYIRSFNAMGERLTLGTQAEYFKTAPSLSNFQNAT
jgi:hypothetical protein